MLLLIPRTSRKERALRARLTALRACPQTNEILAMQVETLRELVAIAEAKADAAERLA